MTQFIITDHLLENEKIDLLEMFQQEWWTVGRTKEELEIILTNSSFILAIRDQENQRLAAFSRVLTDYFKFAYVYDVIVNKPYRGLGLGNTLLDAIINHPKLDKVINIELLCRKEMIPFYNKFGFAEICGENVAMRLRKNPIEK